MLNEKNTKNLRQEFKDSLSTWHEAINPAQLHYADVIKKSWKNTAYVVRNLPFAPEKLVVCPPHSILNMAPNQQHRTDYASGVFEGLSAEPQLDSAGKIKDISVVLLMPRMQRLMRSMRARGFNLHMPIEKIAQANLDIVAIQGAKLVTDDDGSPSRAYIRPAAGPGVGQWGVALKPNYFIETSILAFLWKSYFADIEKVYYKEGLKIAVTGAKRNFKIAGKHASNYGAAATDAAVVRALKYDELMYLAPYCLKNGEMDFGITEHSKLLKHGVLADGAVQEVFGLLKDGETLVYPPLRVNRLGGTVLDYLVNHLSKNMGLRAIERDITLEQIQNGEVIALGFAGNAVKIIPVGSIDFIEADANATHTDSASSIKNITSIAKFGIHPTIAKIMRQFEAELSGRVPPSHSSLLTPVDLEWGKKFKEYLDEYWSNFGFTPLC